MASVTVATITPKAIVDHCVFRGVTSEALLSTAGIPATVIVEPRARISAAQVFTLWGEAQRATHDACIAEHVAASLPFGAFQIPDYLLAAGPTPRDGLQKFIRSFPLVNNLFGLRLTSNQAGASLELHNPYDSEEPSRLYVEFIFAMIQSRMRFAAGEDWRPKEVWFTHPAPPLEGDFHQSFRCRVRFKQPLNQIVMEREFLESSLRYGDALLSDILFQHAQGLLKQASGERDFLGDLRKVLSGGLGSGDLRLKATAKKLALSGRSLQRELNSRGTSYRKELDRFRRDLVLDVLPREQVDAMVTLIGFSESSSFYRAFRRWTGKTPQEYLDLPLS